MKSILHCLICLVVLLASGANAQFDPVRPIPADAPKTTMIVTDERTLELDGDAYRLAVGGQILNQKNMITLTQALRNGKYLVRVKFNPQGDVHRVWILTAAEAAVDAPSLKTVKPSWWRIF